MMGLLLPDGRGAELLAQDKWGRTPVHMLLASLAVQQADAVAACLEHIPRSSPALRLQDTAGRTPLQVLV
jgi:hypothetical protein